MTSQSSFQHYTRIAQHFTSTRALEVLALQASPILGGLLGGFSLERWGVIRPGLLLLGSLALTAHIFVFNDWAAYSSDIRDPQRVTLVFAQQGISRHEVASLAIALLIFALIGLAMKKPSLNLGALPALIA
jgi:4-hydroxybenzoate polyprenyltransferase